MTHYGTLETQRVENVRDIRGTTVRGSEGEKLGTVEDVIFDHDTMEIRYLVVDSGGWLEAGTFLLKGSDRIITPPDAPAPANASSSGQGSRGSGDRQVTAAELFPERMTKVFTDPAPSGGKVTLRPKSVARAEDAASGVTLLKPQWWDAFENYLSVNRRDIQAKCSQCDEEKRQVA